LQGKFKKGFPATVFRTSNNIDNKQQQQQQQQQQQWHNHNDYLLFDASDIIMKNSAALGSKSNRRIARDIAVQSMGPFGTYVPNLDSSYWDRTQGFNERLGLIDTRYRTAARL